MADFGADVILVVPEAEGFMVGGAADFETALAAAGLVTPAATFAVARARLSLLGAAVGATAGVFGFLLKSVSLDSGVGIGEHLPDSRKRKDMT